MVRHSSDRIYIDTNVLLLGMLSLRQRRFSSAFPVTKIFFCSIIISSEYRIFVLFYFHTELFLTPRHFSSNLSAGAESWWRSGAVHRDNGATRTEWQE